MHKQYQTQLTLADGIVDLMSPNEDANRRLIESLLPSENKNDLQFKPSPSNSNVTLIFHKRYEKGERPCGWTSMTEVPAGFDVASISRTRQNEAVAA